MVMNDGGMATQPAINIGEEEEEEEEDTTCRRLFSLLKL
jgi:hypothetical protein